MGSVLVSLIQVDVGLGGRIVSDRTTKLARWSGNRAKMDLEAVPGAKEDDEGLSV